MPVYVCCSQPHCYEKSPQAHVPDNELGDLWYCKKHKTLEDRNCQYTGCNLPGIWTDPKLNGRGYCQHHRRYVLDGMRESRTDKLAQAVDCATYAFEFIIAKGCDCSVDTHKGTCHVLASKNALDSIKAKLGDS